MTEPYRYRSGEVLGAAPAPVSRSAPTRRRSPLLARARRAKADPLWATRSPESKSALIALDLKEARR